MTRLRRRGGLRVLAAVFGVLATSVGTGVPSVEAQPVPPDGALEPDDGAPPEEYVPSPEAHTVFPSSDSTGRATATATDQLPDDGLPEAPPADNVFPIAGYTRSTCSNNFGVPRWPDRIHLGLDCFAPRGTPLVAAEAGTIRYATAGEAFNCSSGGDISGNRVSVRGVSGYVYYYGHLDQIFVDDDWQVAKGQVIGTLGGTGNASCSTPHLHFEVKCGENGTPFDPYPVLGQWRAASGPVAGWPTATEGNGAGIVSSGPDRQDLFTLECARAIRQRTWTSSGGLASSWLALPGEATSDPDAAWPGPGWEPQVFVRGNDYAIWQLYWTHSGWQMDSLGGYCTSGPSAVYSGPTRLDVFCRGADMALWQKWWTADGGWSVWVPVGGIATSDPDAAVPGAGWSAQIFVRGTDNAVWQLYWNGSAWLMNGLGGYCTSGPSAVYSGPERVDVYCRGSDLALWHRQWRLSSGWSGWARIDSIVVSAPEATSRGPNAAPQVFGRGVDRRWYELRLNGSGWDRDTWGLT